MKNSTKQMCEIAELAFKLIQEMLKAPHLMPKQFEAPELCNVAGVLNARLVQHGFVFKYPASTIKVSAGKRGAK
jgi:hypothetical protein